MPKELYHRVLPDNLDQTATSCQSTKFNSPSPQVTTNQQQQLAQQSALDQLVQTYITMGFPPQVALQAAFQQQQSGKLCTSINFNFVSIIIFYTSD